MSDQQASTCGYRHEGDCPHWCPIPDAYAPKALWIHRDGPDCTAIRAAFADSNRDVGNWALPQIAVAALLKLGWRPPAGRPLPGSGADLHARHANDPEPEDGT